MQVSFIRPFFENVLSSLRAILLVFICSLSRNETPLLQKSNKLLLGNLRTSREWVILPSLQSKIKFKVLSSLTNQHSVLFPSMLLIQLSTNLRLIYFLVSVIGTSKWIETKYLLETFTICIKKKLSCRRIWPRHTFKRNNSGHQESLLYTLKLR